MTFSGHVGRRRPTRSLTRRRRAPCGDLPAGLPRRHSQPDPASSRSTPPPARSRPESSPTRTNRCGLNVDLEYTGVPGDVSAACASSTDPPLHDLAERCTRSHYRHRDISHSVYVQPDRVVASAVSHTQPPPCSHVADGVVTIRTRTHDHATPHSPAIALLAPWLVAHAHRVDRRRIGGGHRGDARAERLETAPSPCRRHPRRLPRRASGRRGQPVHAPAEAISRPGQYGFTDRGVAVPRRSRSAQGSRPALPPVPPDNGDFVWIAGRRRARRRRQPTTATSIRVRLRRSSWSTTPAWPRSCGSPTAASTASPSPPPSSRR